jgi:succinyl-diaminopimelate desuccinylase
MTLPTTLDAMLSATLAQQLNETLLWLCAIPSPTSDEKRICDEIEARLQKMPTIGTIVRIGDSLVAPFAAAPPSPLAPPASPVKKRPRIALVGHLDTVRTENQEPRIEKGRCYGAGAADMKSGLAVMLVLAQTLPRASLPCDLTFIFYAREEGPFEENELGDVLARSPDLETLDMAVCLEPSDNKLHLGCNGSLHASLTFEGRTAHSARPWEGDNAIYHAAAFLAELRDRKPVVKPVEELVYRTVTTATQARDGGRGRNVVPDRFILNVNHRFAPSTSVEDAKKELLALVAGRAKVEFTDLSPAAPPNRTHPLVGALLRAGAAGPEPKQAWTDVARFATKGIPAINFGPGENAQAHQKNESTATALVHDGYSILRKWLTSMG